MHDLMVVAREKEYEGLAVVLSDVTTAAFAIADRTR